MGVVKCKCVVDGDSGACYRFVREYGVLTEFVPNAERCEIVGESEDGSVKKYRWLGKGKLLGANMYIQWTEETHWDDKNLSLAFRQIEGDYKKYQGTWKFEPREDKTEMQFVLDYKIDHPLMSFVIEKIIDSLMKKNTNEMLDNIKRRIESEPSRQ